MHWLQPLAFWATKFNLFGTFSTSLSALSGGRMEPQYMETVQWHTAREWGKRGCDSIFHAFGTLVDAMECTRKDTLGDLFQGGNTYGEGPASF